ncbi:MAG: group I intron-associated PD-(D/E)XK endonuclease [Candidatus Nanoarchaeia archaeon]|nr:group I intron-associated PD-(D/E)XK endonuclease [Candidatus Nanoarchaeia archaeon]
MNTKKEKGDIGLAKTIADLTKNGIHVSLPISEHLKYDIIGEKNGICKKIQVRYTTPKENGIMSVKLKSVWSNKKGNHVLKRNIGDFDILAIYCPLNEKSYYIEDKNFINETSINFRVNENIKTNQKHKSRLAKDFENCNIFWKSA